KEISQQESKDLQERERAARAEATRANHAKDQFLAVLSHELRTPLTPVLLAANMLEENPQLPRHLRGELATIRRNVELEARLIDDLLDLTRIARAKLKVEFADADLHELIARAVNICGSENKVAIRTDLQAI